MNGYIFEGKWRQYKNEIKGRWSDLTDDDLIQINGKKDLLLSKLEARYGYGREHAESELMHFENSCKGEKVFYKAKESVRSRLNHQSYCQDKMSDLDEKGIRKKKSDTRATSD